MKASKELKKLVMLSSKCSSKEEFRLKATLEGLDDSMTFKNMVLFWIYQLRTQHSIIWDWSVFALVVGGIGFFAIFGGIHAAKMTVSKGFLFVGLTITIAVSVVGSFIIVANKIDDFCTQLMPS